MKLYICVLSSISTTIIRADVLFFLFSRPYQVCISLFIPTTEVSPDLRPTYQRNPSYARERIKQGSEYHGSNEKLAQSGNLASHFGKTLRLDDKATP